ncbi:hypothetical protein FHR92_005370 [Fontibacillus solani]|uniref:Large polyvalent protein associated domain-containing protein n=1 Tax=Fontibacillus solani TaxID=1572857 RepID=A0A7W3SZ25_9BACL|nr:LPD38 domain-containing protein [Fontibacillus solani]MBA9088825.1 hypothetical protein [Fontibacillus solani]
MTLNFDSLRTNKKRGEDARNRVMQRVYGSGVNGTEEQTNEQGILNFDVLRNRPITDEKGLGKPMSELQQSFGAVTPLNLMNAAVYDSAVKQQSSQPQKTQYDKNIEKINQGNEPEFLKGISRGGEWLFHGNPVGRFISNSLPSDPMTYQRDSTGSKVADKVSDVLYSVTSPLLTPTGAPIGTGPIAGTYDVAGKMLASPAGLKVEQAAANQLSKLFSKPQTAKAITNEALREGIAGSMQGTAYGLMSNHDDGELLNDALLGGGLGFGAGALFKGAGLGISKLLSRNGIPESEIAEILALPEGKLDSRMSAAAERSVLQAGTDPIVNPYQFDLPEATPATRAAMANASEGRTALQQIDNALNDLNTKYEQSVIDEYKVLKEARDTNGSKPEWYKQFYRENKKRPSNKDLYQLARERTDGGYRVETGYDNQLSELAAAREGMQNSLREIDPALKVVDQPIISQELKDTRVTPLGNQRSTVPFEPVQPGTTRRELSPREIEINEKIAAGGNLTSDDIDYILSRGIPDTPKIEPVAPKPLPEIDPNASPILRPGQFEDQSGLGITPFSKVGPYDSLRTDTRSQLMSRQYKEPRGLTANADRLYTSLVDDLHPLNRQDQILDEVMGEKIPSSQRIHDLGLASRGADVVAKRIITDGLVDAEGKVVGESLKSILSPMKQLMRKNKHIYVDFEDYLLNKHAITRFERGEKVFRDELNWSPTYGSQKVSEYERMFPRFKEMSSKLYEFQNQMAQKWLVDTGMIPQEMLDAWKQQNPYYVPNKRYFSELEKTGKGFGGKKRGFGNQSNPVKSYQKGGSQRKIISPIESIIENVDAYVKSAKRNKVMQQYVKNIERAPDDFEPWAEVVKQPEKPDDIAKIIMDEGGLDELLFRFSADFDKAMQRTQLDKDNVVRAMMDGEAVHVKIKDKQLLSALTALGPEQSDIVMKVVGNTTNIMKLLTTGSNPVFTFTRNLMRDIPQAYIASKTRDNPIAFTTDLFSAAVDIARNKGAYREFLDVGGGHASPIAADRNLLAQSKRLVLPQSGAVPRIARAKDIYENILNTVEITPRLAEFKRAKQQTGDIQEALKAAQDITVNFKRKGSAVRSLDKVFPYMNAAIQGMDKTLRTYRDDPVKALVKTALAITLPTMALYAVNHDDPNYQKLSNRTKDAFLLIPRGDGTFIKIAKPQEQGTVFSDIPERLMRMFAEEDPTAFRDFADRLRTTLLPPGVQGALKGGGLTEGMLGVVGDTIFGPFADLAANETFSGAPIVPGNLENLSPGLQSDAKTTNIARWIGEQTHGIPFIEQSPKQLDYLVRQYTGFLGQFGQPLLSPGGDVGYALSQQMTADPVFSNDLSTEFYHYKSKLDHAYNDRELKQVPEWYSDPLRKRLNKLNQNMSAVRKEIRAVQGDRNLSNAEKRDKLRELQERINRIAEQGNSMAREVVPY